MAIYDNGASFQGGSLNVTSTNKVTNLNASMLNSITSDGFLQRKGGITQNNDGDISFAGRKAIFNTSAEIRIGNVIIKSSDNGNGILIGV